MQHELDRRALAIRRLREEHWRREREMEDIRRRVGRGDESEELNRLKRNITYVDKERRVGQYLSIPHGYDTPWIACKN